PLLQMPIGYVVQTASPAEGLGPGERQAVAGGFFVMFSLAIAVAIGWWVTPAAPSFTANDSQARSALPASTAPGRNGERAADKRAATSPALASGDREAVGEISRLPEAAKVVGSAAAAPIAAAAPLAKNAQGKPAASPPESNSPAGTTDSGDKSGTGNTSGMS